MTAETRTFRPLETLIEPQVLPPPPNRHALLAFLLALAAILHLGTAGWSDIHNGAEGHYAGSARAMITQSGEQTEITLLHVLIIGYFKLFGVSPAVARIPVALAMIAGVGLTFLIGERLRDYWRGFVAGLIHLCLLGSFVWGRLITPEPLLAAAVAGAIFCAICGYQRRPTRARWFAATAGCMALAWMCEGVVGFLYPAVILLVLALMFREARLRFAQLFRWPNIVIFLAIALSWQFWTRSDLLAPFTANPTGREGISVVRFVGLHAAWWFSALMLVLPGACLAWRKVFRLHEFDFSEALPLVWMLAGFVPPLLAPHRQEYDSMVMWSAFALFVATAWDRMPRIYRLIGISGVLLIGIALVGASAYDASKILPVFSGAGWRTVLLLAGLATLITAGLAAYFSIRHRYILAIAILMLGMVPVGLSAAEAMARLGAHFSLANAAHFLNSRLQEEGEVLYEGRAYAASSLSFYLQKPFSAVDEAAALERFGQSHPVYLIIRRERVPHWQARLTERFHLYHQEITCGSHVVVNNQP